MKNNSGFTFIELLVTLTVFSICFLPLLNMYAVSIEQTNQARIISNARFLAQEGMEKMKNYNFTVDQLKQIGDVWEPPLNEKAINIDKMGWRILREVDSSTDPITVYIKVFDDGDVRIKGKSAKPIVKLVTMIEDFEW